MKADALYFNLTLSLLPFFLFFYLNNRINLRKEVRSRQYAMPLVAAVYTLGSMLFSGYLTQVYLEWFQGIGEIFGESAAAWIRNLILQSDAYVAVVIFHTVAMAIFVLLKLCLTRILGKIPVRPEGMIGALMEVVYDHDEAENSWTVKEHYSQARVFLKTAYYASLVLAVLTLFITCGMYRDHRVNVPFFPVFAALVLGEAAFFLDGLNAEECKTSVTMQSDNAQRIALYPLLRKPLRDLFGDKLAAEGTTVNDGGATVSAIEDVLVDLEKNGGHVGKNYAAFIRKKMESGLKPNVDYVRCGYDLATGKSLLFNTPFYDKLNPYLFYAMNRELLIGGKVLIVLGRHGTEEDLHKWTAAGMESVSHVPGLWKIKVLTGEKTHEDDLPDVGILSRSGVHDLDIHKNMLSFLKKVSFVVVVEPSRLVTTAQIGLNLLIKCCGKEGPITFCSVDRNCDGLVDALSHILMTSITEVSATEYPQGMSSYMYWTADDDYLQHRILPGVTRCLGVGTELSMVALKNQVEKTVWYGGEAFPVLDARWIAKQYYYDLLDYAQLPSNQETFDKCFRASFNMSDERVSDLSFITVEDDRNNLFETRRNFATIAQQQGFVNVISSEYMLREYMADNVEVFTADPKAIPYITADYARTKRNAILSLCLLLCVDHVSLETLMRQMAMLNIDTKDPASEIWKEVCVIFGQENLVDKHGVPILSVCTREGKRVRFEQKDTLLYTRAYSVETGRYESVYTIENADFSRIILEDLQNASYIAEQESKDVYIGTELKGHVYQKYMPGQLFTLNGKYYEMVGTATDNRILVRRASDHIGGRLAYRQVRSYTVRRLEDSDSMGALKTVNDIDIHYQYADFSVETPGYWKLRSRNDFDSGDLVKVNGVPVRDYHHKQVLKFDFSRLGDAFNDEVRMTLTNLLNEVFVTLFADNQGLISAVTPGSYEAPLTYSLTLEEGLENAEKCIFIIEDSQLDIGLLVAVERNVNRILQIISDYLSWNEEKIEESLREPKAVKQPEAFDVYAPDPPAEEEKKAEPEKKKGFFGRLLERIRNVFRKKKPAEREGTQEQPAAPEAPTPEVPEEVPQETPVEAPEAEALAEENAEEIPEEETDVEVTCEEEPAQAETPEEGEVSADG